MWCEASAKTGEGVQDVFMAIAKKLPLSAPQSQKGAASARAGGAGRGGGVDLSKQTSAPDGCNC
jgi:Ras-related protein Rab-5C